MKCRQTDVRPRPARRGGPLTLLVVSLLALLGAAAPAAGGDAGELAALRAARRAVAREHNLAPQKSGPSRFGLLVIPVDFADARLPADFQPGDLSGRLFPGRGESLHNYFRIASGGRLDLSITLAPVVHLPDARRQYSDRDLQGFTRTRRLATETLVAVRELGLEFRRLDLDGPDGVAGSGDDDGQVDGVLILHAGPGTENDPEAGLIQALQFFLDEPVVSQGIGASFYAVASLQSGPGIWAHETAHLLGLEDRYDPLLHAAGDSELRSRGGLGRFSLMASGAWGTGGGFGAALPDAYSSAQLGWYRMRNLQPTAADTLVAAVRSGEVGRVWTRGECTDEFFLLETRDPLASAPFDADVPGGQLIIYHVDETVPAASWREDGPGQWHLGVRLVEADADARLARGLDDGTAADLFPGPLGLTDFGPLTVPASTGYGGVPSRVALGSIQAHGGGVSFAVALDTGPSLHFDAGFGPGSGPRALDLTVRETGTPFNTLTAVVRAVAGGEGGRFTGTGGAEVTFALTAQAGGSWVPSIPVFWEPPADLPAGAQTDFRFTFSDGAAVLPAAVRTWVWNLSGQELDFAGAWPGSWVIGHPDGQMATTWHRWQGPPWLTANGAPVLACTGASFTEPAAWPAVAYVNRAHTTLTSAPLPPTVRGVRMTHAIEVEMLTGSTGLDGGLVRWVGPDGAEVAAEPLEGYRGAIAAASYNPLHGRPAFVADSLSLDGSRPDYLVPLWRQDTFAVPATGPGPWRLRLVFAANTIWSARGWFVADLEAISQPDEPVAARLAWAGDLTWNWPGPSVATEFRLESRPADGTAWRTLLTEPFAPAGSGTFQLGGGRLLQLLGGSERQRHQVRVVGLLPVGALATATAVVYRDGGDGDDSRLGLPWPNPANGSLSFLLQVPAGESARLSIHDLTGRTVLSGPVTAGQQVFRWDGRDAQGARVAAGLYFIRLEGSGPTLTRKVVLLH